MTVGVIGFCVVRMRERYKGKYWQDTKKIWAGMKIILDIAIQFNYIARCGLILIFIDILVR